jgi:Ni/Fe-hydrogenase subunit HybB-like protein
LWYTPQLPALFFMSSIAAGLALVIMVLYLCVRSLGVRVEYSILRDVSRVVVLMLSFYGLFRGVDLVTRGAVANLWQLRAETGWFWLEVTLLVIAPLILLNLRRVQESPIALYWTSALVVMGFMANRVNVSITGLLGHAGVPYVPKWTEWASTIAVFAGAVVVFRWAVLNLPIFPREARRQPVDMPWRGAPALLPDLKMKPQTSRVQ